MADYFCRIITEDCSDRTGARIMAYFRDRLGIVDFSPLQPYWKMSGRGELTCQFASDRAPEDIRLLFANHWDSNTADSSRSMIHCPGVTFLWIEKD